MKEMNEDLGVLHGFVLVLSKASELTHCCIVLIHCSWHVAWLAHCFHFLVRGSKNQKGWSGGRGGWKSAGFRRRASELRDWAFQRWRSIMGSLKEPLKMPVRMA